MRTVDNTKKKRRGYGMSVAEKKSRRRLNRRTIHLQKQQQARQQERSSIQELELDRDNFGAIEQHPDGTEAGMPPPVTHGRPLEEQGDHHQHVQDHEAAPAGVSPTMGMAKISRRRRRRRPASLTVKVPVDAAVEKRRKRTSGESKFGTQHNATSVDDEHDESEEILSGDRLTSSKIRKGNGTGAVDGGVMKNVEKNNRKRILVDSQSEIEQELDEASSHHSMSLQNGDIKDKEDNNQQRHRNKITKSSREDDRIGRLLQTQGRHGKSICSGLRLKKMTIKSRSLVQTQLEDDIISSGDLNSTSFIQDRHEDDVPAMMEQQLIEKRRQQKREKEVEIEVEESSQDSDHPPPVRRNARTNRTSRGILESLEDSSVDSSIQLVGRRRQSAQKNTCTTANTQSSSPTRSNRYQPYSAQEDIPCSADVSPSSSSSPGDDEDDSSFEYMPSQKPTSMHGKKGCTDTIKQRVSTRKRSQVQNLKRDAVHQDENEDTDHDYVDHGYGKVGSSKAVTRNNSATDSSTTNYNRQEDPSLTQGVPSQDASVSESFNLKESQNAEIHIGNGAHMSSHRHTKKQSFEQAVQALSGLIQQISHFSTVSKFISAKDLDNLVRSIVHQYDELNHLRQEKECTANDEEPVVGLSQSILDTVSQLPVCASKGISKLELRHALVMIHVYILKFHLRTSCIEDVYGIYLNSKETEKRPSITTTGRHTNGVKALIHDENLFLNSLEMLTSMVEQDDMGEFTVATATTNHYSSDAEEECIFVPLISYLHIIPPDVLVSHVLSTKVKMKANHVGEEANPIARDIHRLLVSLPNMHSYSWMELTIAFVYKLRFFLLSSVQGLPLGSNKQDDLIRATRGIFDPLPLSFLEGLESLDPSLPNAILKKLNDGKRGFEYFFDRSFLDWSREYIMDFVCCESKYLLTITCNGIYAPLSDHYGTEIANVPWIDINKNDITFFTGSLKSGGAEQEDACLGSMFSERRFVSISFEDLENDALLSDGKHALMLPISSDESKRYKLGLLLQNYDLESSPSAVSDDNLIDLNRKLQLPSQEQNHCPTHIEIIFPRKEYSNLKITLQNRKVDIQVEHDSDEGSNSTVASIKSRMSTRNQMRVARTHLELSTKFGQQFPQRLLDAQEFIVSEVTKRGVESPAAYESCDTQESDKKADVSINQEEFTQGNKSDVKATGDDLHSQDLTTPARKKHCSPASQHSQDARICKATQMTRNPSAAEITPLQPTNMRQRGSDTKQMSPNRDGTLGAFDTLSSVLGIVDVSEMFHVDNIEAFLKDRRVGDIAEAVRDYDSALSKAALQMKALVDAQKRLASLTDAIDTNYISEAASLIRSGAENRRKFKEKHELHFLSDWASKKE